LPQSPLPSCRGRLVEQGSFPPTDFSVFSGTTAHPTPHTPPCLDFRLVHRVAATHLHARGLPCSTHSCRDVPSLLPRRSASVRRLSTFPRRATFTLSSAVRPPRYLTGLHLGLLRATARRFAAAGLHPTAYRSRFCWRSRDLTQGTALPYCSAVHRGGLLSSHKERAASRRTMTRIHTDSHTPDVWCRPRSGRSEARNGLE
jgi:hypothetical protein